MENKTSDQHPHFGHLVFYSSIVVGVTIWLATYLSAHSYWKQKQLQESGQLGDSFGGTNALFTMFAFIAAAAAVSIQYQTLKEQRESQARLVAEQQRTSQAEAAATIASSIAAWTTLTERLKYRGKIDIPHLRLAIQESRNRVLLELQMAALRSGNPPTMQYIESTQVWKDNQSILRSVNIMVSLTAILKSDIYGFLIAAPDSRVEMLRTNAATWKSMAAMAKNELAIMMVDRLTEILQDTSLSALESAIKETIELLKIEAAEQLGLFEVP